MGEAVDLAAHIRDIPDFPKPGITFKDITPMLANPAAFRAVIDGVTDRFNADSIDVVLGIEARGFILGAPIADRLQAGFVPVRKAGKLPWEIEQEEYELEYGADLLEIHRDAVSPGQRVLITDDVIATGGTAAATARLVKRLGGEIVGFGFIIELAFLAGRSKLPNHRIESLLTYD